ncbi:hypothetical protein ACFLRA_04080, partial [Bdellovibrionota bacterium]
LRNREGIIESRTKAKVFTSGGCAHLYLNVKGREKNGIVSPPEDGNEYYDLRNEIKKLFQEWTSNGEPVFEQVLTREEASSIHLNHPNSGDLILMATPGRHLKSSTSGGEIIEPANFKGQHGYLASHPSMRPVLLATGPGIKADDVPFLHNNNIVPMVKSLLGITDNNTNNLEFLP